MSKTFSINNPEGSRQDYSHKPLQTHISKVYEEFAYILDYLPYGRPTYDRNQRFQSSIVQIIGEKFFTLLEAQLKPGITAQSQERVYIGKKNREKILRIIGKIGFDDLTALAKSEVDNILIKIIELQSQRFLDFFNHSSAVTPRMHSLELIPGIGKKLMWHIIEEREKKPFEDFKDLQNRTGLTDPVKMIAQRIHRELSKESKYRIFSRA